MTEESGNPAAEHRVVLTFDDGPDPRYTERLLDLLQQAEVKAVFFVLGKRVAAPGGRDVVRRAFESGHRVGNHSYSHAQLARLSDSQIRDEVLRTEELISEFLGDRRLFRASYGAHSQSLERVLRELDYHLVPWNVDPKDWKKSNQPTRWMQIALEGISTKPFANVLCHDIQPTTVEHLSEFVYRVRRCAETRIVEYACPLVLPTVTADHAHGTGTDEFT